MPSPARFPTTQWSRVISAGDPDAPLARESLAELCAAYWYPLYAYIRRRGYGPEQARDLTQDFFTRAIEKGLLAEADPARGRFRSFLRTVCAHFLANRRDWEQARKRGGGRAVVPIDGAGAEGQYARELADGLTPDRIFDRTWALTLLGRVLDRLPPGGGRGGPRRSRPGGGPPPASGRRRGPRGSPPTGSAAGTATCSARRSRPRWPTRPRSMTKSGTSSRHSGREAGDFDGPTRGA